ncbi:hypothetical protein M3Y97_00649800 [Aphelenchoides bicaudatus]|nr:hypothetical protein M3Y97_00649800 [Aphelenchoides bicaudatus]
MGEKREIPIVKKKNMKTKGVSKLLVYQSRIHVPATTLIYLLKLDLQTAKCRVVDKTEFDGDWKQICYDIKNSSKFAFILDRGHECVYYGEIENSRIKFNQDIALFGESDKFCGLNLMNGKFYGFNVDRINRNNAENNEVNRENQDVDYVELHAENGRIVSRILRTIRPRNAKDFNKTIINHFRHNQLKYDVCGTTYFFPVWIGDGNNCMLYKFDMVTNELTRIGTHIVANILEMDVNEDGFMTVLSSNQMYDTTVYRFAVKTPDTLQNLSVFAVCRQLTPTDTSRYSLIKDLMPNRLQAFDLFAPQPLKRKQKTKKPKKETTNETIELRRSSRIQSAPSSSTVDDEQVSKRVKTS